MGVGDRLVLRERCSRPISAPYKPARERKVQRRGQRSECPSSRDETTSIGVPRMFRRPHASPHGRRTLKPPLATRAQNNHSDPSPASHKGCNWSRCPHPHERPSPCRCAASTSSGGRVRLVRARTLPCCSSWRAFSARDGVLDGQILRVQYLGTASTAVFKRVAAATPAHPHAKGAREKARGPTLEPLGTDCLSTRGGAGWNWCPVSYCRNHVCMEFGVGRHGRS